MQWLLHWSVIFKKLLHKNWSKNLKILEDGTFDDITFEWFEANSVIKIGLNVFNKINDKLEIFEYLSCDIENQPPKYDLTKIFVL